MKTVTITLSIFFLSLISLSGCSISYTQIDWDGSDKTIKDQEDIKALKEVMAESDNELKKNKLINSKQNYAASDPVFLNIWGSVHLLNNEFNEAIALYGRVIEILKNDGLSYYSEKEILSPSMNIPEQNTATVNVSNKENAEILRGVHKMLNNGHRHILLNALKERSGHIPEPPVYEGLIGLALESMSETMKRDFFHPKIFPYNSTNNDFDHTNKAINYTLMNLITAHLLSGNLEGLKATINEIMAFKNYNRSRRLNTYMALGLYVIGDETWSDYATNEVNQMFKHL